MEDMAIFFRYFSKNHENLRANGVQILIFAKKKGVTNLRNSLVFSLSGQKDSNLRPPAPKAKSDSFISLSICVKIYISFYLPNTCVFEKFCVFLHCFIGLCPFCVLLFAQIVSSPA